MISPDVFEERKVRVDDYLPGIPSPISFNLHLTSEKSTYSIGLSFKEAKATKRALATAIKRMMKNPTNNKINQYK